MLLLVLSVSACALIGPAAAEAQNTWLSAWGGLFMDPGTVVDDESGTQWDLGTSLAVGVTAQRQIGAQLVAGLDLGYAPIKHEVQPITAGAAEAEGRAHLILAMIAGRLGAGGGGGFGTYLTGGIGTVVYGIPSLERWDPDFAFRGGGGLEYRHAPTISFFLEWTRYWVFHQTEGVDDNTVKHAHLEIGARIGR